MSVNVEIDWALVSKRLRCPQCGEKANIAPGTDGHEGYHEHRFPLTREMARKLSLPSASEALQKLGEQVLVLQELGVSTEEILNSIRKPQPDHAPEWAEEV